MARAALVLLALCRLASSNECAGHHEKVCMEACHPNEGENVDEDCCAQKHQQWCADGYRLVESNHVCYKEGEVEAHDTCCVLCDGEEECHNGPGDEWLEKNECPDHVLLFFLWILFVLIFITLCACSWTFFVISLCNYPKLGSGQELCCANCCSPPVWFKISVGLVFCNLVLFIVMCVFNDIGGLVCYLLMMIGTAVAAGLLKSKQASWNQATGPTAMAGGQVQMGPIVGQPVLGQPVLGQPVLGQPVVGQPPMGQVVVGQTLPVKNL